MTLSMYVATVPVLTQILDSLSQVLSKAEAHARAKNIAPEVLLQARLYPDMFALTRQVQIAADFAKGIAGRLAQAELPAYEDTEVSFADLQARIAKTKAFIVALDVAAFAGSEAREIVLRPGTDKEKKLTGHAYLLNYGLPQFLFHATTTYAILRHNGIEVGKKDFMGAY
ncbi:MULTISPECIES: DUF1993 domain-containing protein [unclassified Undibacterium]|uniref:DUF1993 domain-containing protein n=1 Tax=unclassified Undibacterium TaxID=2630295 RepID=UPI002AC8B37A|nr:MULTISPECIES: DUF1993 domain-containing protein [unclassified Undibacterium]MEB0140617.1 DUF1993 domain-containing protein [Undibacterium sp. CCC2.1]MEB0173477.1 DUF1993 domain-containing protein [Undibacterium sp. CCC1.1]MEB0177621.1 DUF1993 domain-containing protein [Undibacterium sp. CCC3.4]MEB0216795.1 DUF1993 domain-containing protein [Undibacterium sp. 5I2]WPX44655.1 DUF1993 domain-containing protein [Undibacterium sp. CCC3.4]